MQKCQALECYVICMHANASAALQCRGLVALCFTSLLCRGTGTRGMELADGHAKPTLLNGCRGRFR